MGRKNLILSVACLCLLLQAGCMTAADHQRSLGSAQEREMTLGVVQKEIRVGMSQADVATALGSPNMVSKDDAGKETWIYDKIATEASYSNSSSSVGGGVGAGGLAGPALILGGIGGSHSQNAGASSSSQKTLTVVIKFGKNNNVESYTYHSSKF